MLSLHQLLQTKVAVREIIYASFDTFLNVLKESAWSYSEQGGWWELKALAIVCLWHSNKSGHKTGKRWKVCISFSLRLSWTEKYPLARHLNRTYCLALPIHVKEVAMVKEIWPRKPWAEHQDTLCAPWLSPCLHILLPDWLCMISITHTQKPRDYE